MASIDMKEDVRREAAAAEFNTKTRRGPGGWRNLLGCHARSLQWFRVGLGSLLTMELFLRFRFLEPFYSDAGTLPTHLLSGKVDALYRLVCVHCHFGQLWHQQVLLTVQVVLAAMFTWGLYTPYTTAASWFLYTSLTLRNTWLNYILDRYFHYLLFLAMSLPLQPVPPQPRQQQGSRGPSLSWVVVSPATIALKALIVWIYLDAGYGKYADPGGGWSFAAQPLPALDTYARHTTAAQYMYALLHPVDGFRYLTPIVVYVELLAAPIALLASYAGWPRIVHASIYTMWWLHVGIALTLRNSAMLSFVACAAWIPLLVPSSVDETSSDDLALNASSWRPRAVQFAVSLLAIGGLVGGNVWFEAVGCDISAPVQTIWSTLLHNRWNVFVGAEEYVTWEIAPGLLQDGSIVDVWGRRDAVDWTLPGSGAPCTATARPGRWRSFPYLAELRGEDAQALWGYLCREWDHNNDAGTNPGRKLVKYNFFMLQADVLPAMRFSPTRKRLIQSFDCASNAVISNDGPSADAEPALDTEKPLVDGASEEVAQVTRDEL
jgi:hypothetical protein